jgi:phage baseplate assembly protein W
MELLSHPFRLTPAGYAETVTEGTEADVEQALAVLIGTRKGERPQVPHFGVTDPTFSALDAAEANAALAVFGPQIRVTRIERTPRTDTTEDVRVEWEWASDAVT